MIQLIILISLITSPLFASDSLSYTEHRDEEISKLRDGIYPHIADDVYIQLYLARLVKARLALPEHQAALRYAEAVYKRREELYYKNASTKEELESAESAWVSAQARVQQSYAHIEELRAMFNIAVDRISMGLDMPLCGEMP